jgi:hypothetical protein
MANHKGRPHSSSSAGERRVNSRNFPACVHALSFGLFAPGGTPRSLGGFMVQRLFVTAIMLPVLCGSSFAKNAITRAQILATYTKEDCGTLTAILAREGTSDEVDAMRKEGKLLIINAQTKIVVERVEVGGVLIHVRGNSQKLWISSNALLHRCTWSEEGDQKGPD